MTVFFDSLHVKYEYEPEGFELPDGSRYLPDFRVKCFGKRGDRDQKPFDLWIEVKDNHYEGFNGAFVDGFSNDKIAFNKYKVVSLFIIESISSNKLNPSLVYATKGSVCA